MLIAVAGLGYAGMLVGQVLGADQGTEKMREVADAIREGANAYLMRQFKALVPLVFLITADPLLRHGRGDRRGASSAGRLAFAAGARSSPGWSGSWA